jgi:hypothetical protein
VKPKSDVFKLLIPLQRLWVLLGKYDFENTCPIQKIAAGTKAVKHFQVHCPYHPPPGSQHAFHSRHMSYLLKKKCTVLKFIIY